MEDHAMHCLETIYCLNSRPNPAERGVLIRQLTLLIKKASLAKSYPGGVAGFLATHLAREYDHLVRYISMSSGEIQQVLDGLMAVGVDIGQSCAIAEFRQGPLASCTGIEFYTTNMPGHLPRWEARLSPKESETENRRVVQSLPAGPEQPQAVASLTAQNVSACLDSLPKVKKPVISRFPYLVVRIMGAVFQYETIAVGEGKPEVSVGCRRTRVLHPRPFEEDGTISGACRELLIRGVKETVEKTGFRMCIVWGEHSCSYVEKGGEIIESTEKPSGGFSLVPDPTAFRSRQVPGRKEGGI